jgi:hypothetical protein
MISYFVNASRGNKKFLMSVLDALNELRADDFVQLYLQAQSPSVYKLAKGETDPHALLLSEIAEHETLISFTKDHAAIILQAMYAAPSISNPAKAVAMLMMGATLDYEDFSKRFGKDGDLEPQAFEKHELDQNMIYRAFRAGANHSEDVRFIIDKASISSRIFQNDTYIPSLFTGHYKFNQETFTQFLDASIDQHKVELLNYAPKGFFGSDYAEAMIANDVLPDGDLLYVALPELYQAGRVESFKKLLPKIFEANKYPHDLVRSHLAGQLVGEPFADLSPEKIEIRGIFKKAYDQYTASVLDGSAEVSSTGSYHFTKDTLINYFLANDVESFSQLLHNATQSQPVDDDRDPYGELYIHIGNYVMHEIRENGVTSNMKTMLQLLKDTVATRMTQAVDLVCEMPEVTLEEHKRDKRSDRLAEMEKRFGGRPQIVRVSRDEIGLG